MFLPCMTTTATPCFVEKMSFAHSARLTACSSQASHFPMLVNWLTNPVDFRIIPDRLVEWINHYDFEVFIQAVFGDPVTIEYTKRLARSSHAFFSDGPMTPCVCQAINTMCSGFPVSDTLRNRSLTASPPYTNTVYYKPQLTTSIPLFGFIAQFVRLIHACRFGNLVHSRELTQFPTAESLDVAHDIRLLFLVQLFYIFVRTHLVN
ncbi:hypothetical protein RF11_06121 [Thelohanellus kitauei]|uniref:Uncharacterized protein n=1 Tax=Thelohanellus kitauei TaxID=669202 RepID=A0A0C2IVM0_THEKT|nr:hypothetical protein RF11_06121 [Thelohanellus kitauei]